MGIRFIPLVQVKHVIVAISEGLAASIVRNKVNLIVNVLMWSEFCESSNYKEARKSTS